MSSKPRIRLLVTDLDNTLYDWVTFFSRSLYAMVERACEILSTPRERLLDDLREVHRHYRDSETPYALIETRAVRERFPGLDRQELADKLDDAFHRFNSVRKETLRLFPRVQETLAAIAESGVHVVGHTEATVPNAVFRLERLGIAGLFDRLYASAHEGPQPPTAGWRAAETAIAVGQLPRGEHKPNPAVLRDICAESNVAPGDTLYVGDSVVRDVGMAKAAGTWAAWARYGTRYEPEHWQRLVRITHWTEKDVARHAELERRLGDSQPDAVLERGFFELLDLFSFGESEGSSSNVCA